mmetsp:Transcript_60401/g.148209  ORF Transcript_60401/g.148209 Transcript_60401/m.148209 type:complete len:80 (-) Transcript_60401:6-245(-)
MKVCVDQNDRNIVEFCMRDCQFSWSTSALACTRSTIKSKDPIVVDTRTTNSSFKLTTEFERKKNKQKIEFKTSSHLICW